MRKCDLIKVINCQDEYEFYFKVKCIGYTKVFNRRWEAEKFIESKGYAYNYSEQYTDNI